MLPLEGEGGQGGEQAADSMHNAHRSGAAQGQGRKRGRRRGKRFIKFATINAQSLGNKMGDLAGRMETFRRENKEPSIIGVTESWGRDKLLLNLKDFTAYRNDRSDGKGGGNPLCHRWNRTKGMSTAEYAGL